MTNSDKIKAQQRMLGFGTRIPTSRVVDADGNVYSIKIGIRDALFKSISRNGGFRRFEHELAKPHRE